MLKNAGFDVLLPQGAYYIIAGTDRLMKEFKVKDDFAFSYKLIERTKVATVPGTSFYFNHKEKGRSQVRFCFCKKDETLDRVEEGLSSIWK